MKVDQVHRELEQARSRGPLKDIIIEPCPRQLVELRAVLRSMDPEPGEIVRVASSDVAMAAALIKVANSPLYARSRSASTVADAVAMLGVAHSVSILTGFVVRRSFPTQSPLLEHFWLSSARRATAMGYVARQLIDIDPEVAHTCGLFCHIALPVLIKGLRGYEATLQSAMAATEQSFTEVENGAHQTDHAVVGAIVAKTWLLPPEIALAVRLHHDFSVLTDESVPLAVRQLVAMLLVTEHMVAQYEHVPETSDWQLHGSAGLALLHVQEHEVTVWADALHDQFASETV
ncbi:HDOD domain-containing protein [Curvibacter sp. APW13]|uniref:HDOD domain-containing protein n=1 Tax=Curvibacter sp. APW13 TaxID=3077236 RepID=UPI0028DFF54E|nr:HDOD domain-containing protein [Curvibacter sp. APW13]MDT8992033.1 HDOD domain-containing protein [Curvibacter sp. APW13]